MKGRNMSLVFLMILLTGIVMVTGCGNSKSKGYVPDHVDVSDLLYRAEIKTEESADKIADEPLKKEFEAYFTDANYITVEKVERTIIEDADGNSETIYDTYLVSDIDLNYGSDDTSDYSKLLSEEKQDDSLVENIDFEKAFGFSYKGKTGYEVLKMLLESNGIDGDMNQAEYDQNTNAATKQDIYKVMDACSILDQMISGVTYDEIIDSRVFYQVLEVSDGIIIPDYITAVVKYRKDDEIITKSLFLQVAVNNWTEMEVTDEMGNC